MHFVTCERDFENVYMLVFSKEIYRKIWYNGDTMTVKEAYNAR